MLWEKRDHEEPTENESRTGCWILSPPCSPEVQQTFKGWRMLRPLHVEAAVICYRDWRANSLENTAWVHKYLALAPEDVGSGLISKYPISVHRFGSEKRTGKATSVHQLGSPEAASTMSSPPPLSPPLPRSPNENWEKRGCKGGSALLYHCRTPCLYLQHPAFGVGGATEQLDQTQVIHLVLSKTSSLCSWRCQGRCERNIYRSSLVCTAWPCHLTFN